MTTPQKYYAAGAAFILAGIAVSVAQELVVGVLAIAGIGLFIWGRRTDPSRSYMALWPVVACMAAAGAAGLFLGYAGMSLGAF